MHERRLLHGQTCACFERSGERSWLRPSESSLWQGWLLKEGGLLHCSWKRKLQQRKVSWLVQPAQVLHILDLDLKSMFRSKNAEICVTDEVTIKGHLGERGFMA